ncbi:MAG: hypothetical protein QOJ49_554 [Actinomycetota bacterium]|jgi:predicted nucleic acid-binding Zn ribbon protein|nr:hypothetical protein [Actinomycetota bacterium]
MTDVPEDPPPQEPGPTPRRGLDIAKEAVASARAEARRRGLGPGQPDEGGRTGGANDVARRRRRAADAERRSSAHPDERDPQLLGSSVDRLVTERGWQTEAAVGGAIGRWATIVGPEIAEHATPVSFDDGELVVAAATTAWATQLRLLAPVLIGRMNESLGTRTVLAVRVLAPGAPSWKHGPRSVPGRGPRDTYG